MIPPLHIVSRKMDCIHIKTKLVGNEFGPILELGIPTQVICRVCNTSTHPSRGAVDSVRLKDVIQIGNWYYTIPRTHAECREMFLLNPMAYDVRGEQTHVF